MPDKNTAFKLRTAGLDGNVILSNVVFNKCSGMARLGQFACIECSHVAEICYNVYLMPDHICSNAASVAYEMVANGACLKGTWLSTVHGLPSVQACSVKARGTKSSKPITYFTYAASNGECAFYTGTCTGGDSRKHFSTYKLNIGSEEGSYKF